MIDKGNLKVIGQQILVVLIAAILVLIALKFLFSTKYFPKSQVNQELEKQIKEIKNKQDSLNKVILVIRKDQEVLIKKEEQNNIMIEKNNQDLQIIKNKYNEKINNVGTYTPTQLDSFFTDRYGKYN